MLRNFLIFITSIFVLLFTNIQETTAQGVISFTLTQQPCNYDGVLTANITGLIPPITVNYYLYNNGTITHTTSSTTDVLNNYSGGPLYVYATGSGSTTAYGNYQGAAPFNFGVNYTPGVCPAFGSATIINITGGAAPFSYQWEDANQNIVGTGATLSAPNGYYNGIVTDANGCKFSMKDRYDSIQAISNSAAFHFNVNTTVANCTNGTATIGPITGTGVPPYSYMWSNSATTLAINNLTAGTYNATVTDAQGCSATQHAQITQSPSITVNTTSTAATCTQNDGAAIAFAAGGASPYTYIWSNGPITPNQTNLSPGNYSVIATDANGCMGTGYTHINTSTPITATFTTTASSCTSATGSATLSVSGGVAPYTTSWNTSPVQSGLTASNLPAGNYNFTVTDANGCVRSGTVMIPPVTVLSVTTAITNASCTQSDGSIIVTPVGGITPYTYLWNNSNTTNSITNVPQGYYSVVITDNNGCTTTKNASVLSTTPISVGLSSTQASCQFLNDGSISALPTGGAAPYVYAWSNGQTTNTASSLLAGNYTVHVTDANGCTASKFANLSYDANNNSCYCTITGTVFNDINGNCTQDAGENGIPNIQIHCSGIGYAYTNASGVYSFIVPSGTYTISESVQTIYPLAACQNNSQTITTTASSGCTQTINFANTSSTIHDVHISTWNMSCAVPGNTYTQTIVISNDGTVAENAILAGYKNDGQLNAATFIPSGIFNGGSSNWYASSSFSNLVPGAAQAFNIQYAVPTNIPMNTVVNFKDSVSNTAPISNWLNDYTPWNNVNDLNATIVSSFDPNFKEVLPKGTGPQGYIYTTDSVLEYMVHFQNLGTYKAQNIVVIDTLSPNLDWKTLKPIYSSHQGKMTIDENGVLKFVFANINLPAEMYDKVGSNGMFTYSVHQKPNLATQTEITNNASIYFDYNAPIVTNTTINTIKEPLSIKQNENAAWGFKIYPNPTKGDCIVTLNNPSTTNAKAQVQITDLSGRALLLYDIQLQKGNQQIALKTNNLTSGVYFVTITVDGIKNTQKLVLVK